MSGRRPLGGHLPAAFPERRETGRASAWAAGRRSPSTCGCRYRRGVRTAGPTFSPAPTSGVRLRPRGRGPTRCGSAERSDDVGLIVGRIPGAELAAAPDDALDVAPPSAAPADRRRRRGRGGPEPQAAGGTPDALTVRMPEQKLTVPVCPRRENGHLWRFERERSTGHCQADVCQACGLVRLTSYRTGQVVRYAGSGSAPMMPADDRRRGNGRPISGERRP